MAYNPSLPQTGIPLEICERQEAMDYLAIRGTEKEELKEELGSGLDLGQVN